LLGVSSSILFTGGIFPNNAFGIFEFYGTKARFKYMFLGGRKKKRRRKRSFISHILILENFQLNVTNLMMDHRSFLIILKILKDGKAQFDILIFSMREFLDFFSI
jgi:hypothetical protein